MSCYRWILVALMSALAACQLNTEGAPSAEGLVNSLERAAERAEVSIVRKQTIIVSQGGFILVAAPIVGVESIAATHYKDGVDIAFAYLSDPSVTAHQGFYKLRVSAERIELGKVPGTLGWIDARGNVVTSWSAVVDVRSLTVPEDLENEWTMLTARIEMHEDMDTGFGAMLLVESWCTNGVHTSGSGELAPLMPESLPAG